MGKTRYRSRLTREHASGRCCVLLKRTRQAKNIVPLALIFAIWHGACRSLDSPPDPAATPFLTTDDFEKTMFVTTSLNFPVADELPASLRARDEHVPASAAEVEQRAAQLGSQWSREDRIQRRQQADRKLSSLLQAIAPSIGA